MKLIYQVEVIRFDEGVTLMLTTDRMIAIGRARSYNQRRINPGEAVAIAWVEDEYNFAYVDLEDGTLFQIDDGTGCHARINDDFSFAAIVARGETP